KATAELRKLGEAAAPALRKVLEGRPPLEVSRRVEMLLEKIDKRIPSAEELQALRAIDVLERIGTKESQEILKTLASGASGYLLTQHAHAAMARLTKRPGPP